MKKQFALLLILCILLAPLPVLAAPKPDFETTSASIILMNPDTGTIVYQKDADKKVNPGSTTMIMTYIMAAENISNPDMTKIIARKEVLDQVASVDETLKIGISEGEELTAQSLINAMSIATAYDATYLLADFMGQGNIQTFVDNMNKKAESLGCKNTHFTNPTGTYDEKHKTSAEDMVLMTKYARTLPRFSDISNTTTLTLPATNKSEVRTLTTTNKLIDKDSDYYDEFCQGIMAGSSNEGGNSVVSSAVKENSRYLCVALSAPKPAESDDNYGAFTDSSQLYNWAFSTLKIKTIVKAGQSLSDIKVNQSSLKNNLSLLSESVFITILPINIPESDVKITPHLPETLDAPVEKGQVIGTATLSYDGQDLTEVNLIASESVTKSTWIRFLEAAKITGIIILVLLVLAFTYVQVHNYKVRKRKRERREKMRRRKR